MMKTINYYIIVFVTFMLSGTSSYSQYHGGDAAAAATDQLGMTSCPVPAHFYAYFGSTDDNVTVDVLMNTSCSAPPPSFFAYMGGDNDSAGVEELSAVSCGIPPSFFAYMGGDQDSAHVDDLLAISCGTPNQFYAYFGGMDDSFAMEAIGSCPVTPPVADFTASTLATCVGGSIDFTDTSTNVPFVWSWTFAGGTPATSTVQNPSVIYSTPGTYAVTLTATNYNGSDTKTVAGYITVTGVPTVASTTPGARCDAGVVQLQATASAGVLRWYNVPTGGAILGSGPFFPTGIINSTTTFYVEAASGSCVSARTPVTATINVTPTVATTTPGSRCGTGSVTLNATASAGTLSWFANASGGTALGTGTSFATPSISSDTTYYVQAANGSCVSARTAVLATINATPAVVSTTPGSRCDTGSVTLGATASSGTLNWYNVASGGSVLGTGTTFVTPSISSNTNFYVDATNGNCTSARTAVLASASPSPAITNTTPAGRCEAGTVTLSATASAGTISWFDAATGGTALGNGTNFITPSLTATTTFYVETANGSCVSTRVPVIATVTATPSVTATTPAGRCGAGSVTLGATASAGTLNWYSAAVGGTLLGSGTGFATPNIGATTVYYVEASNGSCASARTPVTATISIMPTINATVPASRCDAGSVTLSATASAGTLNWFDVASGGSSLGAGNSFVTPSLNATTTYYVQATSGSCVSPRTAVTATVNATPMIGTTTPGNRCGSGSVALNASATSGIINWYSVSTGGTVLGTGTSFTTPFLSCSTNFYAEAVNGSCTSARVAVLATINTIPMIIATMPGSRCDSGTVTLGATANEGTLNWYNVPTGGSVLGSGTAFITPSINATTNYYVEATNGNCTTARTLVTATVTGTPVITGTTPGSRCDTGTMSLQAASDSGTINWFAAASGGTALATGPTFVTPSIAASTTYYVEVTNGTCTSARTAVTASVNETPTVTSVTPDARCGSGTLTLNATASAGFLRWYAAPTGGAPLATGTSFITPSIAATTTYYVEAKNGTCTSTRTAVTATVTPVPVIATVTPGATCGTGTVTLGATATSGVLSWYDVPTGGTALSAGITFVTPSIGTTTTYYVEASNGACTSGRTAVTATVNNIPSITTTIPGERCGSGIVTLSATGAGTINWYGVASGGAVLATGTSFQTPSLAATTTYYVAVDNGNCVSNRTAVTATINAIPAIISTSPATRCGTGDVMLEAVASAGIVNWYDQSVGGTLLSSGSLFQTNSLSATATFYAEAVNGDCNSTRVPVTATVNIVAPPTGSSNQSFCNGQIVGQLITVGTDVSWYDAPTGGNLVADGALLVDGTTYYASQNDGSCDSDVRLAVTVSTGACLAVDQPERYELKVYPNPVSDFLNIAYEQNISQVEVVNMIGQLVISRKVNGTETKLDLSALAAGTYLVKVSADNLFRTIKIIKR
ncbi:MAG: hypothetical protein CFE23_04040 [Flavobacterium sp. BFFFF1]|uniref:Ig-like domain-containing protein n=1 Tax=Flavobacterium sp. BFFFF1 TaxID=2015557 RepID=UPI000BDCC269|nr:T9SS type A sorting domain-containing protein [Flavobacterium sp. BFFFF1]OYU81647.1 MAG: hypothetical protein CFE23_04040 [Flavobacterium sp. BFFFF1]